MTISDIMTRDVQVVRAETTIREAAEKMASNDVGALPVCDGDKLLGMVTDRDIVVRGLAKGLSGSDTVSRVMTEGVEYCFDDDELTDVEDKMATSQIRRIAVVDRDKKLVGILSLGDVSREARPAEAGDVLEEVSQPGGNNLQ
jgi:CBS domain-containing protein